MFPKSSDDQWLEDIMRSMFAQSRTSPPNRTPEDEPNASQAAKDARRMARMAMQMAIGALDAADDRQDQMEKSLWRKLAAEKKEKANLQHRLTEELERRDEVERMRRSMDQMKQEEKEQERLREEFKRERRRREQDMERDAAERKAAEELKKAKEEARKACEEAARARQEAKLAHERAKQAEEAQRKQSAQSDSPQQPKDKEQVRDTAAWARYTDQWELFKRFSLVAGAGAGGGVFRFEDIPWPAVTPPASPSAITKKEVESFLFSSYSGQNKPLKTRIRECLLIWHPDKFSGRWMRFVIEADRARVTEGVSAVTRAGNELMADYANRRRTM